MSDLHGNIAEIIETAIDNTMDIDVTYGDLANAAATEIIAALPGRVPELVWTHAEDEYVSGGYRLHEMTDGSWCSMFLETGCGVYARLADGVSEQKAKAAANAHRVAALMAAMGVEL